MPTFEVTRPFRRDYARLTLQQKATLFAAVRRFVQDLRSGMFRRGLRVKAIRGAAGIFEMTWAPDGRATFQFGPPVTRGEVHVIWRRCGTHDVRDTP